MPRREDADFAPVPFSSLIFGFGPMAPFAAAAIGAWFLAPPWPALATHLAIIWGGAILIFVAGVRRGFGFGEPDASNAREIATMLVYFVLGSLSLVLAGASQTVVALMLQVIAYILVPIFDRRAAFAGDAPPYFARLRGPQMAIAVAALVALLVRRVSSM
jgi:hypothetical protein